MKTVPSTSKPLPLSHAVKHARAGQAALKIVAIVGIVGLGAASAVLFSKTQQQDAELSQARIQLQELTTLQEEVARLEKQAAAQSPQSDRAQKDQQELVKLRGEVAALRPLKDEVEKLQAENTKLQASVQQMRQISGELATLKNQNQQLKTAATQQEQEAHVRACRQNLRLLQNAKARWAAENNKTASDYPLDQDLFGLNQVMSEKPVCPSGGQYTLGTTQETPTCTAPGHIY